MPSPGGPGIDACLRRQAPESEPMLVLIAVVRDRSQPAPAARVIPAGRLETRPPPAPDVGPHGGGISPSLRGDYIRLRGPTARWPNTTTCPSSGNSSPASRGRCRRLPRRTRCPPWTGQCRSSTRTPPRSCPTSSSTGTTRIRESVSPSRYERGLARGSRGAAAGSLPGEHGGGSRRRGSWGWTAGSPGTTPATGRLVGEVRNGGRIHRHSTGLYALKAWRDPMEKEGAQ